MREMEIGDDTRDVYGPRLGCELPAIAADLTAIDVLIQPGPTMVQAAGDWNAKMRAQSPEGFLLDPEHAPHVTLVQRFVTTQDLDKALAAVSAVKESFNLGELQMTATGFYHIPSGEIGFAGIVTAPSPGFSPCNRR